MGLLIIDETRCKRDGICVRECPSVVIQIGGNGLPEILSGAERNCLDCGHCVAVCPHGALNHQRVPAAGSPAIKANLRIDEERALQFLRSRRSIRHFVQKPVEKNAIRRLIEGARYAPSAGNSQLVEWLVIGDKSRLREISRLTVDWVREVAKNPEIVAASPYLPVVVSAWDAGFDSVLRDAPALVIASAPREAMNGLVDVTISLTYLDLLAPAMGLGTCWAGLLQGALVHTPSLKKVVGIPENHTQHYPMMVGYPEFTYHRVPERRAPRIVFA